MYVLTLEASNGGFESRTCEFGTVRGERERERERERARVFSLSRGFCDERSRVELLHELRVEDTLRDREERIEEGVPRVSQVDLAATVQIVDLRHRQP